MIVELTVEQVRLLGEGLRLTMPLNYQRGFDRRAQDFIAAYEHRSELFSRESGILRSLSQEVSDLSGRLSDLSSRKVLVSRPLTPEVKAEVRRTGDFTQVDESIRVLLEKVLSSGREVPFVARLYAGFYLKSKRGSLDEQIKEVRKRLELARSNFTEAANEQGREFEPKLESADLTLRQATGRVLDLCNSHVARRPRRAYLRAYFSAVPGREEMVADAVVQARLCSPDALRLFPEFARQLRLMVLIDRQLSREIAAEWGSLVCLGLPPSKDQLRQQLKVQKSGRWQKFLGEKIIKNWQQQGLIAKKNGGTEFKVSS